MAERFAPHGCIVLALAALQMPLCFAVPDDSTQPIQIQADRAQLDERQGTATYVGGVHLTQGTLQVTADRLVITSTNGEVVRILAEGVATPVHYSQKAKADQPPLVADARTITYLPRDKRIKLSGNAHLTQGRNKFSGANIDYDIARQFVAASGGGGVRVTIDPTKTDPGKPEPGKTDPGKTEPGKIEPNKPDAGRAAGAKHDPARTATEPVSKTAPDAAGQAMPDPAKQH